MKKKNMLIVGLCCILGLSLSVLLLLFGNHPAEAMIGGTVLYNSQPAPGFVAFITFNDGHIEHAAPGVNGKYSINAAPDDLKTIQIFYEDKQLIMYGPPFDAMKDYGVNHNIREETV